MTLPGHHPVDELLFDYASGALNEPVALVVATHLALCPTCRHQVQALEEVGGLVLDGIEPQPVSVDCLEALLARLDDPLPHDIGFPPLPSETLLLPQPLRSYIGLPPEELAWRPVCAGVESYDMKLGQGEMRTRLFRLRAGAVVPRHTHRGTELTLVLEGGFLDCGRHYGRGDVCWHDCHIDHSPCADNSGGCLCLTVTDAPLQLTGRLSRFLNPFLRL